MRYDLSQVKIKKSLQYYFVFYRRRLNGFDLPLSPGKLKKVISLRSLRLCGEL
jgi:hypothetical protein